MKRERERESKYLRLLIGEGKYFSGVILGWARIIFSAWSWFQSGHIYDWNCTSPVSVSHEDDDDVCAMQMCKAWHLWGYIKYEFLLLDECFIWRGKRNRLDLFMSMALLASLLLGVCPPEKLFRQKVFPAFNQDDRPTMRIKGIRTVSTCNQFQSRVEPARPSREKKSKMRFQVDEL